jgi:hypothetical protein
MGHRLTASFHMTDGIQRLERQVLRFLRLVLDQHNPDVEVPLGTDVANKQASGQVVVRVTVTSVPTWDSKDLRNATLRLGDYVARDERCRFPRLVYGPDVMAILWEMDARSADAAASVACEICKEIGLKSDSFDPAVIEFEDAAAWARDVFGSGIV